MKMMIKKILIIQFVILESILFSFYLIPELFDLSVNYDEYGFLYLLIVIVFLMSFFEYKKWSKDYILMRICFFFTLIADFFLTYLDSYYHLSLILFILVQLSYFVLINNLFKKKHLKLSILIYFPLVITLIIVALSTNLFSSLNLLAILYYSLSLVNIIYLILIKNKNKNSYCFLLGLILFLLCDTCIGLRNIGIENDVFYEIVSSLIWIFYAPSQVVLVLSLFDVSKLKGGYYEKNNES